MYIFNHFYAVRPAKAIEFAKITQNGGGSKGPRRGGVLGKGAATASALPTRYGYEGAL